MPTDGIKQRSLPMGMEDDDDDDDDEDFSRDGANEENLGANLRLKNS